MKRLVYLVALGVLLLWLVITPGVASADTPSTSNEIVLSTNYPSVVADQSSPVTFSINLSNQTKTWQQLDLSVDGSADWQPTFKSGGYTVRSVMVEPGKSQSVDLQVKAPQDAQPKDYRFVVKATNPNGVTVKDLAVDVMLQNKITRTSLQMTTDYPNLRGQASSSFSFTLNVVNNSDQDRIVNFDTTSPQDWQVTIKPSYQSTQVSSISMKANANQSIQVDVTPPKSAPADQYPIMVKASTGSDTAQLPLSVVIVGQPSLSLATASGQLNTHASADSPSKLTLTVKNTGTDPLQNISLSSSTPDGWQVTFSPSMIDSLAANQTTQVTALINPGNRALAGDYMVSITASAGSTSDSKDIRVTVETPTTWGWAAVGAIAVVVIGLGLVFVRFSRR